MPYVPNCIYWSLGDTPKLEALLQGGLDLDVPIQLSEYIKLMPLEIAVFRNDVPMIHFLLEHGADPGLAEEQPLLLTAARCCGPEVVALFAGQAAKLSLKQKERAFQEVRWGNRPENIPVLEQIGITVAEFGGDAFRSAVSDGNRELTVSLLNYCWKRGRTSTIINLIWCFHTHLHQLQRLPAQMTLIWYVGLLKMEQTLRSPINTAIDLILSRYRIKIKKWLTT